MLWFRGLTSPPLRSLLNQAALGLIPAQSLEVMMEHLPGQPSTAMSD